MRNRGIFILSLSIYILLAFFPLDFILKRVLKFVFVYFLACLFDCKLLGLKEISFFIFLDWGWRIVEFYATREWMISLLQSVYPDVESLTPENRSFDIVFLLTDLFMLWFTFISAWHVNRKLKLAERVGQI